MTAAGAAPATARGIGEPTEAGACSVEEALAEVVGLAVDLIRIDTTNTGDPDSGPGERAAAEYVSARLGEAGYEVTYLEGAGPRRGNVVVRLPGSRPDRGALLVHGHLDVVPAVADEWTVHPLSGEVADGCVWGRGAVDMKHMVAMTLAVARSLRRHGLVPRRDIVFAFLADEECGGRFGARWLAEHRRDLFEGVTEAISEVGGFCVTLPNGRRAYLVQTAEKDAGQLSVQARGRPGHGSLLHGETAISRLVAAVTRLQEHRFPRVVTAAAADFLDGVRELTGEDYPDDDEQAATARFGSLARLLGASLRDTVNVTRLDAGYAGNVVPGLAKATADCRILPGRRADFERELAGLLADVDWQLQVVTGAQTRFDGDLPGHLLAALRSQDPEAHVLPYLLPASTDAKTFAQLGIRNFGFTPLKLPPDLDFAALFHGVDERIPIESLQFGTRVLHRLLLDC